MTTGGQIAMSPTPLRSLALLALGAWLALAAPAAAVDIGDIAPEFRLPATTGGDVSLSDYRGKQMVLIEFYHTDWGPNCTANLERRRDDYERFAELGVQILAISLDHAYSQAAFANSLRLPYPLLSDFPHGRT